MSLGFFDSVKDWSSKKLASTEFVTYVAQATAETLLQPNYDMYMVLVDAANDPKGEWVSDVVRSVRVRMDNPNPKVKLFTVQLICVLVANCGLKFHSELNDAKGLWNSIVEVACLRQDLIRGPLAEARKTAIQLVVNLNYWFKNHPAKEKTSNLANLVQDARSRNTIFENVFPDTTTTIITEKYPKITSATETQRGGGQEITNHAGVPATNYFYSMEAAKKKKLEEETARKKVMIQHQRKQHDVTQAQRQRERDIALAAEVKRKEEHQAAEAKRKQMGTSSSPTINNNNNNAAINVANSAEGTSTTAIANSTISGSVTSVSNSKNVNIDARNIVENIQNKNVQNNNTINNNYITQNIVQQEQTPASPLLAIRLPRVQKKSLELDDENEIGSGSTCTVYQSEYENQQVAVKMFHSHVHSNSTVQREIENLLFLQHPNIIRIFALVLHKPKQLKSKSSSSPPSSPNSPNSGAEEKVVGIICELLGENLQDYLVANHSSISPSQKLVWARQIASAISCAHHNKVAHSDIKPENILLSLSPPFTCHLSDFGSSSVIKTATSASATSVRGTAGYTSPEILQRKSGSTAASDIFSFGGVLWFLFHPDVDHGLGQTAEQINHAVCEGHRPPILLKEQKCPTEVATLIEECWCQKPDDRPHVGNVLKRISDLIQKEK